jgi:hypothetical protein
MPSKQQSIILGGIVVTILSTSYLGLINMLCCLGVLLGSMVAVWHYTETYEVTLKSGDGAKMGAMAAIFGLVVASILNYILVAVFDLRHDQALAQYMLDMFGDSMPPEQYDQTVAEMNAPLTIGKALQGMLWGLVAFPAFGAIGGILGATMFKKGGDEPTEFDD